MRYLGIPGDTWGYLGIPGDTRGYLLRRRRWVATASSTLGCYWTQRAGSCGPVRARAVLVRSRAVAAEGGRVRPSATGRRAGGCGTYRGRAVPTECGGTYRMRRYLPNAAVPTECGGTYRRRAVPTEGVRSRGRCGRARARACERVRMRPRAAVRAERAGVGGAGGCCEFTVATAIGSFLEISWRFPEIDRRSGFVNCLIRQPDPAESRWNPGGVGRNRDFFR